MKRIGTGLAAPWLVVLAACGPRHVDPAPVSAPADPIRAERLSADLRFLSDDLLEGRATGSRGEQLAQRYVAARFAGDGVLPGTRDGYFQPVHLRAAIIVPGSAQVTFHTAKQAGTENPVEPIVAISDGRTADVDVTAPVVFVGYAITAPEYGYDDLAGVDLHGKIAVYYTNTPESDRPGFFPPEGRARYAASKGKLERLAAHGAIGAVAVWRQEDEKRAPWARLAASISKERVYWLDGQELGDSPAGVAMRAVIPAAELGRLADAAGVPRAAIERRPDDGARPPVELGITMHARWRSAFEPRDSSDVVGVVRGTDPKLADEYVVYTAHADHLGMDPKLSGDQIFNGAIDNGSGVATVLEIAGAFARAPARRSALFVITTGEELGLLGAGAFVAHPPVPRGAMIADFNIDEVPGLHPLRDVVVLGVENTTLGAAARAAAASLGVAVSPDPEPEQGYFGRGDNMYFVHAGIPAVRIEPGDLDAHGELAPGKQQHEDWIASHYHTVHDEWSPGDDFESMAQFARFALAFGRAVADAPERPRLLHPVE